MEMEMRRYRICLKVSQEARNLSLLASKNILRLMKMFDYLDI